MAVNKNVKKTVKKKHSVKSRKLIKHSKRRNAFSKPMLDESWGFIKEVFQLKAKQALTFRGALSIIIKFIIIIGIAVWLSPQIDIVPEPYNWIGFIALIIVFVLVEFVWRDKKKKA